MEDRGRSLQAAAASPSFPAPGRVLVLGLHSQHVTKPGPRASRPLRPRQGVMEGRVTRPKTQSHWVPNGNQLL